MASSVARVAPYVLPAITYLAAKDTVADIAQGNYVRAASEGVVAGLSAVPVIIKGTSPLRK